MSLAVASLHSSQVGISGSNLLGLVTTRDTVKATIGNASTPAGSASSAASADSQSSSKQSTPQPQSLSPAEQRRVEELKRIDADVRAHEQAHIAAGQNLITSGPNYTYTYGPDGKQYAIGGEVGIDTSPEKKPEDNIDKGERIQAAALAPRDPSPQDYRVAAVGSQLEAQGRSDLAAERAQSTQSDAQSAPQTTTESGNGEQSTASVANESQAQTSPAIQAYLSLGGESAAPGSRLSAFA